MDYDYSKRGYLLPDGCKDLIDFIQPNTAITERGFIVTVHLSNLQNKDIQITVEGSTLRIQANWVGSHAQLESKIEVPSGYKVAYARANYNYFDGQLRIVVPKAVAF